MHLPPPSLRPRPRREYPGGCLSRDTPEAMCHKPPPTRTLGRCDKEGGHRICRAQSRETQPCHTAGMMTNADIW